MAENYQTLLVTKEAGITTIMFNRPEKRNAMSPQLHREMYQLLTELRYDQETKVVIITGAGDNFCAGQDLKQYGLEMESQPQSVKDDIRDKVRKWRTELLRNLPQPTIARITGWCLGGALTVTVGCDVAIASEDAQFGLPEVNFGHFPAGETTPILANYLQAKHGLYYALSGKMMSGREAERIGLISKAVPRADLDREVAEFAKCLAEKSPLALKAVKEAWYLEHLDRGGNRRCDRQFHFTAHRARSRRPARTRAVRPEKAPAGVRSHEAGKEMSNPGYCPENQRVRCTELRTKGPP